MTALLTETHINNLFSFAKVRDKQDLGEQYLSTNHGPMQALLNATDRYQP